MAERFSTFLESSLRALAREWPVGSARIARALDTRVVAMCVDDDACRISGRGTHPVLHRGRGPSDILLRTDRGTILALADGDLTLLDAALSGRLDLRGGTDDLATFEDALVLYLHGAARTACFPDLLEEFRRGDAA